MTHTSLYDFYNSIFETVIADTEALRQECYRVRHEVFCEELNLFKSFIPDAERDPYDDHAGHGLLRHKETGQYVGTVRLILHKSDTQTLPVYKICAANHLVMPQLAPMERIAEVSRFCIVKSFRRRIVDITAVGSSVTRGELLQDPTRIIPAMSLGLLNALYRLAFTHGVEQYCCGMEKPLFLLLKKLGLHYHPLGPMVDYHGIRQICYASLPDLRARLLQERPDVWNVISDKGSHT